jgi:hypothetical protein
VVKATAEVLAILVIGLVSPCVAGEGRAYLNDSPSRHANEFVKMAVHLAPHSGTCNGVTLDGFQDIARVIDDWSDDPTVGGIDAFLVVFDYDSLTLVEYGLTWPQEWGTGITRICISDPISVGNITFPGNGIAISWIGADCKIPQDRPGGNTPRFLPAAYTWLVPSGSGSIEITPNPYTDVIGVTDCRPDDYRGYEIVTYTYDAQVGRPDCDVSPRSLSFGVVAVGDSADLTFTIANSHYYVISGTVEESCDDFSIVGDPTYYLGPDYQQEFTVRYSPQTPGPKFCEISTGVQCTPVLCTGSDVSNEPATWGGIKAMFGE